MVRMGAPLVTYRKLYARVTGVANPDVHRRSSAHWLTDVVAWFGCVRSSFHFRDNSPSNRSQRPPCADGHHAGLHPKERPHTGHDRAHHWLLVVAGLLTFRKFLRHLAARLQSVAPRTRSVLVSGPCCWPRIFSCCSPMTPPASCCFPRSRSTSPSAARTSSSSPCWSG